MGRGVGASSVGRNARGGAWVAVDSSATQALSKLAKDAAPIAFGIVDEELEALTENASKHWPVRTGKSKASIALVERVRPGVLAKSLVVTAAYAYYVFSSKMGKNAAKALVLDPSKALADRLAKRIAEGVSDGD